MKNEAITSRDVDFAKWYTDVVTAARLCCYSNVKGCVVFEPAGYAIWEKMQSILDKMFKDTGHQNVYMPMLIPESLMKKEAELIDGFAPEVAWVTRGGDKELDERLCVRPTSETLFSDYFSNVVKSYRDLPLKYNQWCSVMRWEKTTRPFLRSREFLWQEGHTVHATQKEAEEEARKMLNVYKSFFEDYLAIPVITGRKTEKEKFAGAEYSLTVEALMYNGVALQSGTSHYFGQKFSKAYDISFVNSENKQEYAYQTSWGCTTRMIGALIMVHSDDFGLVLPPKIAPKQVVIVPIGNVSSKVNQVYEALKNANISVYIDDTNKSPGYKFKEAEVNGIPIRIEIGERDLKNNVYTIARRDTQDKMQVDAEVDIVSYVNSLMEEIQTNLYNRAKERRDKMTYEVDNVADMKKIIDNNPGFIIADWCGNADCEVSLKDINGLKSRCILENEAPVHNCVVCGKEAKHRVVWGIQY
ncbi:MAG: proline--tRNA ligase [bacterium]|nr:proline--tRNA ligase [bacterium]